MVWHCCVPVVAGQPVTHATRCQYYLAGEIVQGRVDLNLVQPVQAKHLAVVRLCASQRLADSENDGQKARKNKRKEKKSKF